MTQRYGFLYKTDSHTDSGYREVDGDTYEAARREWSHQMINEGQQCRLDASQIILPFGRRLAALDGN
jgi:hypothetical protein